MTEERLNVSGFLIDFHYNEASNKDGYLKKMFEWTLNVEKKQYKMLKR